jgi:hypothetical protein
MPTIDVIAGSGETHAHAMKRMHRRNLFGKIIVGF